MIVKNAKKSQIFYDASKCYSLIDVRNWQECLQSFIGVGVIGSGRKRGRFAALPGRWAEF